MRDQHASRTLCSPRLRASVFVVLLVLASIPTLATPAVAGTASLTLAWDANPDPTTVDGYIIEWGHRRGTYTDEVEVGVDVTSYTINGLVDGRRYYIIVRSTAAGVVSAPSNEVSGVATAPPPIPEPEPEPEAEPEVEAEPEPEPDSSSDGNPGNGNGRGRAKPKRSAIGRYFDADAMDDLGVYRPSRGEWHDRGSSGLELFVNDVENSGANTVPVTADFDGDGAADIASWNPSDGTWVVYTSGTGYRRAGDYRLGSGKSIPVPADYDGDGAAELAVFEPNGWWRVRGGGRIGNSESVGISQCRETTTAMAQWTAPCSVRKMVGGMSRVSSRLTSARPATCRCPPTTTATDRLISPSIVRRHRCGTSEISSE